MNHSVAPILVTAFETKDQWNWGLFMEVIGKAFR
jgi:hypothetical protein